MVSDDADRTPVVRASDADREAVVVRLQSGLAEGRIDLDEFDERARAAYAAVTTADLAGLVADLPGGAAAPPPAAVGDVRLDLRGLRSTADRVDLRLGTVFGDLRLRSLAPGEPAKRRWWG